MRRSPLIALATLFISIAPVSLAEAQSGYGFSVRPTRTFERQRDVIRRFEHRPKVTLEAISKSPREAGRVALVSYRVRQGSIDRIELRAGFRKLTTIPVTPGTTSGTARISVPASAGTKKVRVRVYQARRGFQSLNGETKSF
ncbi:MAG: hypothetical protein AAF236_03385 [Verrucomicrobiota bacterium]